MESGTPNFLIDENEFIAGLSPTYIDGSVYDGYEFRPPSPGYIDEDFYPSDSASERQSRALGSPVLRDEAQGFHAADDTPSRRSLPALLIGRTPNPQDVTARGRKDEGYKSTGHVRQDCKALSENVRRKEAEFRPASPSLGRFDGGWECNEGAVADFQSMQCNSLPSAYPGRQRVSSALQGGGAQQSQKRNRDSIRAAFDTGSSRNGQSSVYPRLLSTLSSTSSASHIAEIDSGLEWNGNPSRPLASAVDSPGEQREQYSLSPQKENIRSRGTSDEEDFQPQPAVVYQGASLWDKSPVSLLHYRKVVAAIGEKGKKLFPLSESPLPSTQLAKANERPGNFSPVGLSQKISSGEGGAERGGSAAQNRRRPSPPSINPRQTKARRLAVHTSVHSPSSAADTYDENVNDLTGVNEIYSSQGGPEGPGSHSRGEVGLPPRYNREEPRDARQLPGSRGLSPAGRMSTQASLSARKGCVSGIGGRPGPSMAPEMNGVDSRRSTSYEDAEDKPGEWADVFDKELRVVAASANGANVSARRDSLASREHSVNRAPVSNSVRMIPPTRFISDEKSVDGASQYEGIAIGESFSDGELVSDRSRSSFGRRRRLQPLPLQMRPMGSDEDSMAARRSHLHHDKTPPKSSMSSQRMEMSDSQPVSEDPEALERMLTQSADASMSHRQRRQSSVRLRNPRLEKIDYAALRARRISRPYLSGNANCPQMPALSVYGSKDVAPAASRSKRPLEASSGDDAYSPYAYARGSINSAPRLTGSRHPGANVEARSTSRDTTFDRTGRAMSQAPSIFSDEDYTGSGNASERSAVIMGRRLTGLPTAPRGKVWARVRRDSSQPTVYYNEEREVFESAERAPSSESRMSESGSWGWGKGGTTEPLYSRDDSVAHPADTADGGRSGGSFWGTRTAGSMVSALNSASELHSTQLYKEAVTAGRTNEEFSIQSGKGPDNGYQFVTVRLPPSLNQPRNSPLNPQDPRMASPGPIPIGGADRRKQLLQNSRESVRQFYSRLPVRTRLAAPKKSPGAPDNAESCNFASESEAFVTQSPGGRSYLMHSDAQGHHWASLVVSPPVAPSASGTNAHLGDSAQSREAGLRMTQSDRPPKSALPRRLQNVTENDGAGDSGSQVSLEDEPETVLASQSLDSQKARQARRSKSLDSGSLTPLKSTFAHKRRKGEQSGESRMRGTGGSIEAEQLAAPPSKALDLPGSGSRSRSESPSSSPPLTMSSDMKREFRSSKNTPPTPGVHLASRRSTLAAVEAEALARDSIAGVSRASASQNGETQIIGGCPQLRPQQPDSSLEVPPLNLSRESVSVPPPPSKTSVNGAIVTSRPLQMALAAAAGDGCSSPISTPRPVPPRSRAISISSEGLKGAEAPRASERNVTLPKSVPAAVSDVCDPHLEAPPQPEDEQQAWMDSSYSEFSGVTMHMPEASDDAHALESRSPSLALFSEDGGRAASTAGARPEGENEQNVSKADKGRKDAPGSRRRMSEQEKRRISVASFGCQVMDPREFDWEQENGIDDVPQKSRKARKKTTSQRDRLKRLAAASIRKTKQPPLTFFPIDKVPKYLLHPRRLSSVSKDKGNLALTNGSGLLALDNGEVNDESNGSLALPHGEEGRPYRRPTRLRRKPLRYWLGEKVEEVRLPGSECPSIVGVHVRDIPNEYVSTTSMAKLKALMDGKEVYDSNEAAGDTSASKSLAIRQSSRSPSPFPLLALPPPFESSVNTDRTIIPYSSKDRLFSASPSPLEIPARSDNQAERAQSSERRRKRGEHTGRSAKGQKARRSGDAAMKGPIAAQPKRKSAAVDKKRSEGNRNGEARASRSSARFSEDHEVAIPAISDSESVVLRSARRGARKRTELLDDQDDERNALALASKTSTFPIHLGPLSFAPIEGGTGAPFEVALVFETEDFTVVEIRVPPESSKGLDTTSHSDLSALVVSSGKGKCLLQVGSAACRLNQQEAIRRAEARAKKRRESFDGDEDQDGVDEVRFDRSRQGDQRKGASVLDFGGQSFMSSLGGDQGKGSDSLEGEEGLCCLCSQGDFFHIPENLDYNFTNLSKRQDLILSVTLITSRV